MLPSMPILFTRESQDAFGNKIEASTSIYNANSVAKPVINTQFQPTLPKAAHEVSTITKGPENNKVKDIKKKEDTRINNNAFESALIRSYYTKVRSRFSANSTAPTNKFVQFQNILKTFDPNKETPVDLYKKIENLFGEGHKDIVEDFLLFLKPGQAAEVGRFMDRFMMVQMTGFIELLQATFARKPTVLRKIVRAISTGINSGSSTEMKTRVLPHLRSNERLTQMFKALFPDERPPDSAYETGTDIINESFLTNDKGYDVWEFAEETDNKRKLDANDRLDTMYLHGRVFLQHGRLLRSARVTFPYSKEPYRVHARRLAPAHSHPSPPESDDERASPKRNTKSATKIPPKRPKKQLGSPTKNVKDVNDNTKHKDCSIMSPKAKKSQPVKNKKKEDSNVKRERKDSKNHTCKEASKVKQVKIDSNVKIDASLKIDLNEKNDSSIKIDTQPLESKKIELKSNWTRDEDKTMLEVLKGESGSEQVFCRIRELLPHRSSTEIKERFCHVMTLLQQMAVGEVT